jgi:hypothetical protein
MEQCRELMAGKITHNPKVGQLRCKEHKSLMFDRKPPGCPNCSEDLKEAIADMISVIKQYKIHFRHMQRLLATAEPGGR